MLPIRDHNRSHKFPFFTLLIIVTNVFVFLLEITVLDPDTFINSYALIPAAVDFLKPITLVPFFTSMFLHAGFVHLLSNMWFLWIFGDNLEATLGKIKFILFYFLSGLAGGFLQYLLISTSTIPNLGASGAIAGILGGYLVFFPQARIETLVAAFGGYLTKIELPAYVMLFYWFFTQLFSGTAGVVSGEMALGGVAWFAHIGGFVAGWFMAKTLKGSLPEEAQYIEDKKDRLFRL